MSTHRAVATVFCTGAPCATAGPSFTGREMAGEDLVARTQDRVHPWGDTAGHPPNSGPLDFGSVGKEKKHPLLLSAMAQNYKGWVC